MVEPQARERILATAYELFSRQGIRAVGVDEVIQRAGVAKATLYRHFSSKDELVLAFLRRREQVWTLDWVEAEAKRGGSTPEEQLLAIFDAFDGWFRRDDFEARQASSISRTSDRLCDASRRRQVFAILTRSRARGTSS